MNAKRWIVTFLAFSMLFSLGYLLIGCSEDESSTPAGPVDTEYTANSQADCQDCHTNEDMLKATVIPDEEVAQIASDNGYPPRMAAGEG
jgi:hypothetical protein